MTEFVPPYNPDHRFGRQLGFFNPTDHPDAHVTFVGCGGIGSFAAFGAAKLGIPKLTLVDFDRVEEHNAPNQYHGLNHLGEPKVEALAQEIQTHMGTEALAVETHNEKGEDTELSGLVVTGLDSKQARRDIWEKAKMNPDIEFLMDARLGGQLIVIYSLNPCDLDAIPFYEKTLEGEGMGAPCTERGVIDVGLAVGALLVRQIRQYYNDEPVDPVTYVNHKTLSVQKGAWVGAS